MTGCSCEPFELAASRHFNTKKVAEELKRYRDDGLGTTTRLLVDGITEAGALAGSVLDVGSGFGSLALALLDRGALYATSVDASAAYVSAARDEAARRGRGDVIRFVYADFVEHGSHIPSASIVTLDRVVCCYPGFEPLVEAAVAHTDRCLALSYPRDAWWVRTAMRLENGQPWAVRNPFRTFVHPPAAIERLITRAGLRLANRRASGMWSADVYVRP